MNIECTDNKITKRDRTGRAPREREEAERAEQDAVVENLYNFKGILRFNPCGLSDQLIVYFNFAKKG